MDPVLTQANDNIQKAIDHFKLEMSGIRAGRANPALIENIPVEAYGARMKLMEVGTISAPQPSLLTVQVWDVSLLNNVIKAIQESNIGLNPASDGQLIRLPIPPLTTERREEFIKLTSKKTEDVKVHIRQVRQDTRQIWEGEKTKGDIGEDELKRREKLLQDLIDKKILEIEELAKIKEQELMEL